MKRAERDRRRRVKAAALVAFAAELDALTKRMKLLPRTDPDTFTRADAICTVLRRGVEDLKKGSVIPPPAPLGTGWRGTSS